MQAGGEIVPLPIDPVEQGLLDWLEVHELEEVVAAGIDGRQSERDVVVLKHTGTPVLALALVQLVLERAAH